MSKILVIDDNALISQMLEHALVDHGYEVHTAADANQGYAAAVEFRPDLILLDVQLPDVLGFDLCRVLKNHEALRDVAVVMITGTARSTEEKVKGFQMGIDDYILKPFEMPELLERIRAILRRAQSAPVSGAEPVSVGRDAALGAAAVSHTEQTKTLPLQDAVLTVLLAPQTYPAETPFPKAGTAYLASAIGMTVLSLGLAAGDVPKISLGMLAVVAVWGTAVSALVMACSIMGVTLPWKEGGRLASLAGVPLLLKLAGGLVLSFWTTLSPTLFTTGPALFLSARSPVVERFDIFEWWSVALLWVLLRQRPGSSPRKAVVVAVIVWAVAVAWAIGLGKIG